MGGQKHSKDTCSWLCSGVFENFLIRDNIELCGYIPAKVRYCPLEGILHSNFPFVFPIFFVSLVLPHRSQCTSQNEVRPVRDVLCGNIDFIGASKTSNIGVHPSHPKSSPGCQARP